jgi:PAS domain S-box-containing protein
VRSTRRSSSADGPAKKTEIAAGQWSEAQLRGVVDSITEHAILATDPDGYITLWTHAAERVFEYRPEEILGRHVGILFTPEDREHGAHLEEMRQAALSGRASDERYHLRKGGTRFYCSGVMSPIHGADGEVAGYVKVARDLTAQREQAEALIAVRDELETRVAERTRQLLASRDALARELEERTAAERRVRSLLARMVSLQEEERRRIARDLHDNIGQQMTALHLQLAALAREFAADGDTSGEKLKHVQATVRELEQELDFLTWELRPGALYNVGLVPALMDFVTAFSQNYQLPIEFECLGMPERRLDREVEVNLYRIVQESLNNAHKHARAGKVVVLLQHLDGRIVLTVSDDGAGFVVDPSIPRDVDSGLGLEGMRERAAMIGGALDIESVPGGGTSIIVTAPAVFSPAGEADLTVESALRARSATRE